MQAISQKYLNNDLILTGSYNYGDSYIWKGIIKAKDRLATSFGAQLGDGSSSFWYSNWLGTCKLCSCVPFVHISDTLLTVSDIWRNGTWNLERLYTIFPSEIAQEIIHVAVPMNPTGVDRVRWTGENDGKYSTTSGYEFLNGDEEQGNHGCWKRIWSSKIPEKIRFFLWLVRKGALPTNEKRFRNHLSTTTACSRCGAVLEDVDHVFRRCPDSRDLWRSLGSTLAENLIYGSWGYCRIAAISYQLQLCGGHGDGGMTAR